MAPSLTAAVAGWVGDQRGIARVDIGASAVPALLKIARVMEATKTEWSQQGELPVWPHKRRRPLAYPHPPPTHTHTHIRSWRGFGLSHKRNKRSLRVPFSLRLQVAIPLPPDQRYHSVFVCPVAKEAATAVNPPMVMQCGHVICSETLQRLTKNNGCVGRAPCAGPLGGTAKRACSSVRICLSVFTAPFMAQAVQVPLLPLGSATDDGQASPLLGHEKRAAQHAAACVQLRQRRPRARIRHSAKRKVLSQGKQKRDPGESMEGVGGEKKAREPATVAGPGIRVLTY